MGEMKMSQSRRNFLKQSAGFAGLLLAAQIPPTRAAETGSVLVNHVGFATKTGKYCLLAGGTPVDFAVVDIHSKQSVFHGTMKSLRGDLGNYQVGDFSECKQAGSFQIVAGNASSGTFVIADDVYASSMRKCISYFSRQRCGDSKTGHHAPCHLDDGRRLDNGRHQDVTGGWHDACDVRKWVNATIYGMTGLLHVLDVKGPQWERAAIAAELRWGNRYFLKMQEPAGYVMDYCGGDDGNNWTDNRQGTSDDRKIHVDACELPSQFQFVAVQAAMARVFREEDASYAKTCETAARNCLQWCLKQPLAFAQSLSAAILAAVEMHRALGGNEYSQLAGEFLKKLLALQVISTQKSSDDPAGFFRAEPDNPLPLRAIMHGNQPLLAMCAAMEYLPDHSDAPSWREGLQHHVDHLVWMSSRSAFGTIPFGLYLDQDPGGNRRVGKYWYRWFMKPRDEHPSSGSWWVGINAHLASHGIGLSKASKLLGSAQLLYFAQRQLDWILGVNPFAVSTVTDVGRNQPALFLADEFHPPTPLISGGVMNGLGGSENDTALLNPGSYNTCEYWTPMTAYTLWLLASLS
jgi:hypothetical protein